MDTVRRTTFEAELNAGRSVTYVTVGTSMEPLLFQNKTQVTIAPVQDVQKWDILLYRRTNGQHILHRLIEQQDGTYYLRGDNTFSLEAVKPEQVLGVVTHIYRKGKLIHVTTDWPYRLYVRLWCSAYPTRNLIRRVRSKLARLQRKGVRPK